MDNMMMETDNFGAKEPRGTRSNFQVPVFQSLRRFPTLHSLQLQQPVPVPTTRSQSKVSYSTLNANVNYVVPEYPDFPIMDFMHDPNWTPNINADMHEILPRLFLGSQIVDGDGALFSSLTHILCLRDKNDLGPKERIVDYCQHRTNLIGCDITIDSLTMGLMPFLEKAINFINSVLAYSTRRLLVHGHKGTNLAAVVLTAYLMSRFGKSADESLQFIQKLRPSVTMSEYFYGQLQGYEPIYRADHALPLGQSIGLTPINNVNPRGSMKRDVSTVEDDDDDMECDVDGESNNMGSYDYDNKRSRSMYS